jgi:hypothetical protein
VIVGLIGVEHRIQWIPKSCGPEWREDLKSFEEHVERAARERRAELIGEEFSEECFSDSTVDTIARRVAARMAIQHLFCEPTTEKRSRMAADDICAERERYWKRRLEMSGAERVVFICGDEHVTTFGTLLREGGHEADVISCKQWGYGWELKK